MSLGKQARVLSKQQIEAMLAYLASTRYAKRNRVIFLLSVKAGLRAKEIANLTWATIVQGPDSDTLSIYLENRTTKGHSGRIIPVNKQLADALAELRRCVWSTTERVVATERGLGISAQAIVNIFTLWYRQLGFTGCSSHSGRRTFITNAARKISTVGGSLRYVQALAGHSSIRTTQGYIEVHEQAQRRI